MSEVSSLGGSSAFKPQRLSATELHAKPSADYADKLATTQALLQREGRWLGDDCGNVQPTNPPAK